MYIILFFDERNSIEHSRSNVAPRFLKEYIIPQYLFKID